MKNKESNPKSNIVDAFESLSKKDNYILTKTRSKRASMVGVGECVRGKFVILEREMFIMVLVDNSAGERKRIDDPTYIRTSPVVGIVNQTDTSISFETEGGFYELEKLKEVKQ